MRHLKAGRKLGRNASHRLALMRNLAAALIEHERITTTVEKAKELRPFVERLVTLARKGTLHARRLAAQKLGPVAGATRYDDEGSAVTDRQLNTILKKLFNVIGPRFQDRPGGYTRILKLHKRRLGDAGQTALIEFLAPGETKPKKKRELAPAPTVEPTPAPAPTSESASSSPASAAATSKPTESQS
jgi:large subunit ribosomal protein L17